MVADYVNISNATLINVSASFGHTAEWLEQRRVYFGRPTNSPPPAPPPEDRIPDVERPFFFDEDGVRVDIPQVARANGLTAHFTTTTGFRMRYILAEGLAERYTLAGKARGDPEKMPNAYFHRAACGDEEATLVKVHVRLLLQPWAQGVDARTDFFMRVYGGTLDAAFRRFDVRSCFTETTENVRLECDPAPSPPPPDNWQKPPSPPAYVYEALTLATATGVVGALLRDQRRVLHRRGRAVHPRAAQLAPAWSALAARGRDALEEGGQRAVRFRAHRALWARRPTARRALGDGLQL